jgi:hypothetical protein
MSVNDADLAQQLWQRTGLQTLFAGMTLDGARAVGLNPNIRMYRWVTAFAQQPPGGCCRHPSLGKQRFMAATWSRRAA